MMKTICKKSRPTLLMLLMLMPLIFAGCLFDDYPIDEDNLLVTERTDCYVSSLELRDVNGQTVLRGTVTDGIDTVACTISKEVKFGTDLKHLYPQFTLAQDCKLDPKVAGLTDFSDLARPRQYTVISGNRQVRRTYTIYITVQASPY
jgi:hypothetical protein